MVSIGKVQRYLKEALGEDVNLKKVTRLGVKAKEGLKDVKEYGYGEPLLLEVEVSGEERKLVLNTIKPSMFGHEFPSDRAKILLWSYEAFNKLPRHVRAVDVGAFMKDSSLKSLREAEEFFLLTEYVEGEEYFKDLEEIRVRGRLLRLDEERAETLAKYISNVHAVKGGDPNLYIRRIRELLGHGEQIMGLIDSYDPKADFLKPGELLEIEKKCVEWRWKLKGKAHRLCQVHGDFHPWNVKFKGRLDFTVLDRSRGEWGEAADDISAMAINYLFFSLMRYGVLKGPFERLWRIFLGKYLDETRDYEVMEVIQPFFAWRGLVIANPIWYPTLKSETRRKIFNFIDNVLESEVFDYREVNSYLRED